MVLILFSQLQKEILHGLLQETIFEFYYIIYIKLFSIDSFLDLNKSN